MSSTPPAPTETAVDPEELGSGVEMEIKEREEEEEEQKSSHLLLTRDKETSGESQRIRDEVYVENLIQLHGVMGSFMVANALVMLMLIELVLSTVRGVPIILSYHSIYPTYQSSDFVVSSQINPMFLSLAYILTSVVDSGFVFLFANPYIGLIEKGTNPVRESTTAIATVLAHMQFGMLVGIIDPLLITAMGGILVGAFLFTAMADRTVHDSLKVGCQWCALLSLLLHWAFLLVFWIHALGRTGAPTILVPMGLFLILVECIYCVVVYMTTIPRKRELYFLLINTLLRLGLGWIVVGSILSL